MRNGNLSKRINQHFVQIPFARLIEMIEYKAEEYGIAVVTTEESYTSGTSFIDNEEPVKENIKICSQRVICFQFRYYNKRRLEWCLSDFKESSPNKMG